jgi:hypothetical protein
MLTSLFIALAPAVALAAPLLKQRDAIPGKYIVKFKSDAVFAFESVTNTLAVAPEHQYSFQGFEGFAGVLSATELAHLQASNSVSWLELQCIQTQDESSTNS